MSFRPRYLHRLTYPFRVLGMGLAALPIGVVLYDLQAGWPAWTWLVLSCGIWPHLAYLWARRSADPYAAEARNFLIDSILAGSWVPMMHFNLLPSAVLVIVVTADKVNSGIPRLWLRALPAMLLATLVVGMATGFEVDLASRTAVILACLPILAIHTLAVSSNIYRLMRRVQAQNLQLEEMTRRDGLTGVDSRGHWEQQARRLLQRHREESVPASLLLLDIDHFKTINDRHGHGVGDDVLRALAQRMRDTLPADGIRGRLGGDEFVVALALPTDQALAHAERLRAAVQALEFPDQPGLEISISVGLAAPPAAGDLRAWLEAADAALYRAKHGGRNRTEQLQPRETSHAP
ncbi:diguanylate cyclase AdrA [Arenimonas soli]|uniref:diguanylate cyclase n=1 Tax=Arenimonas soli TaxID=2269504 RepID=A0ABQ1HEH3_9GAMM|nr:diguanylate cyclase [Arenimonas soli]GGA73912.1 diguanylate cyclase AdrA [Arenimonas soli]